MANMQEHREQISVPISPELRAAIERVAKAQDHAPHGAARIPWFSGA
jgi:hypothetical protein